MSRRLPLSVALLLLLLVLGSTTVVVVFALLRPDWLGRSTGKSIADTSTVSDTVQVDSLPLPSPWEELEQQLRTMEQQLGRLRDSLQRVHAYSDSLQRELQAQQQRFRTGAAPSGSAVGLGAPGSTTVPLPAFTTAPRRRRSRAFLQQLPPRSAAVLLRQMNPRHAARVIAGAAGSVRCRAGAGTGGFPCAIPASRSSLRDSRKFAFATCAWVTMHLLRTLVVVPRVPEGAQRAPGAGVQLLVVLGCGSAEHLCAHGAESLGGRCITTPLPCCSASHSSVWRSWRATRNSAPSWITSCAGSAHYWMPGVGTPTVAEHPQGAIVYFSAEYGHPRELPELLRRLGSALRGLPQDRQRFRGAAGRGRLCSTSTATSNSG
jgi:hypothetical protein